MVPFFIIRFRTVIKNLSKIVIKKAKRLYIGIILYTWSSS